MKKCAKCCHPQDDHHFRHPFVASSPEIPDNSTIKESLQAGKGDGRPWWMDRFDKFCVVNKFGECKYWNPVSFGYDAYDTGCSMDKFFPEKIKAFVQETVSESLRMAAERISKVIERHVAWKPTEGHGSDEERGYQKGLMAEARLLEKEITESIINGGGTLTQ